MIKDVDFKLIPIKVKPKRPIIRRGWTKIMRKFVEGNHNMAYIQLDTKRELHLASAAFNAAVGTWAKGIIVTQYADLLRVYLEKE